MTERDFRKQITPWCADEQRPHVAKIPDIAFRNGPSSIEPPIWKREASRKRWTQILARYAQPYWTGTMVEELARLAERGGGVYRSNRMSWPSNE